MRSTIGPRCVCVVALGLTLAGCSTHADPAAEAPPPAHVEHEQDLNVVRVDHPEQFSLVTAGPARRQIATGGYRNGESRCV